MVEVNAGDKAPGFTLRDQNGNTVRQSGYQGRKLPVYFHPPADTPGRPKQACSVTKSLPALKKLDVAAVGISPDPLERQEKFDEKYELGFPRLSDEDHAVAEK